MEGIPVVPDLTNRSQYESDLTAAIRGVFEDADPDRLAITLAFASAVQPVLGEVYWVAAMRLSMAMGWEIDGDKATRDGDAWAQAYAKTLALEVERSSRGMSPDYILSGERAQAIAVTEVTRAVTAGEDWARAFAVAVLLLEPPKRIWHTAGDDLVCPVCEPLDGEPEERWSVDIPFGPPAHPYCRCYLDYSVL